jgi:hypothetical protein
MHIKSYVTGALALAVVLPTLAPIQHHDPAVLPHHQDHAPEIDHTPLLMQQQADAASSRDVTVALTGVSAIGFAGTVTPSTTVAL